MGKIIKIDMTTKIEIGISCKGETGRYWIFFCLNGDSLKFYISQNEYK
jgi:hypothetical protein